MANETTHRSAREEIKKEYWTHAHVNSPFGERERERANRTPKKQRNKERKIKKIFSTSEDFVKSFDG